VDRSFARLTNGSANSSGSKVHRYSSSFAVHLRCFRVPPPRYVAHLIPPEYCVDILTRISSYIRASEKVASLVLRDHMDHCVREALAHGENADEKVREMQVAVERFQKLD